jgi:hypothetical protein
MMNMNQEFAIPRIVYIMGAGRSGSTVLNIILGAHPEVEAIGEAKHWAIFKGLPREDDINSEDHIFWQNVLEEYIRLDPNFPGFSTLETIRHKVESHSGFIKRFLKNEDSKLADEYDRHLSKLFLSVYQASGKKVILDASKNISRAQRLLETSEFDVKVIHLIRDPRGIVWSFMKKNVEHKPKKPFKALLDYILLNLAAVYLRYSFKDAVLKVKYENLIRHPQRVFQQICDFIGIDEGGISEKLENGAEFKVTHIIDGNRIRKNRAIKFSPDEEWKTKLPFWHRALCMLAWPVYLL